MKYTFLKFSLNSEGKWSLNVVPEKGERIASLKEIWVGPHAVYVPENIPLEEAFYKLRMRLINHLLDETNELNRQIQELRDYEPCNLSA